MRKIDKPHDDPKDIYLTCISRVKNGGLKSRLESIADNVEDAAIEYDQKGLNSRFYSLSEHDNVAGVVTKVEMEKVYTTRMAKKGTPGRPCYDRLKASVPHAVCPLCGHRTVSTIDHYLPKASFPSLVVVPFNLVPACSDCNKLKLSGVPVTAEEQTIHPYYDDITTDQWLYAEVIEDTPVSIKFFVKTKNDWSDTLKLRIQEHFKVFGLGSLYASQSGVELANIRSQLKNIFQKAGENSVREHLTEHFQSRYDNHINSWQTAMYQSIADNDWFCCGGFNSI